jgi:TPR repeat protein
LRLASEHGHADSQISLAIRLSENCDASSHNEAIRLFKLALKQGTPRRHLEGLHNIAYCCKKLGDHVEAFNYHRLASDQGHSESSFQLARMYLCGEGVDKDVEEAIKIWKQLIENSKNTCHRFFRERCFEAIRDLHLERGDIAEAFKWCKLGADERDQFQLLHDLARMYEGWDPREWNVPLEGDGIERDFVKAAKCYTLACELFLDANDDVADSAYELAKMCGLPAPRRLMIP